jgi:hypothetical protein
MTLTVAKGRTNNTIAVNIAPLDQRRVECVLEDNGRRRPGRHQLPGAAGSLNWGVPNLTFSNFNVRSSAANSRRDLRTA